VFGTSPEVQPDKTGALLAVVQSWTEGYAPLREEDFGWIVAKRQRPTVQPSKIGRFRRLPLDLGKLSRQKITKKLAVPGELITNGVQPAITLAEACLGSDDPEYSYPIGQRWHSAYGCRARSVAVINNAVFSPATLNAFDAEVKAMPCSRAASETSNHGV